MSLDVDLMVIEPVSVFSLNITHNLGKMAGEVKLSNGKTLYDVLWRPDENDYYTAEDISELLDEATFMGETPFTLEVTSPGIDRPLTLPRHFAKNIDRLLKVTKTDGVVVTGRILSNSESDVTLSVTEKKDVKEVVISLADIKRAQVEIEFNRKEGDK